jgi:hypothetical protein
MNDFGSDKSLIAKMEQSVSFHINAKDSYLDKELLTNKTIYFFFSEPKRNANSVFQFSYIRREQDAFPIGGN